MGNQLLKGGNYGLYSPSGAPIGLSPAMLEFLLIDPTIRSMIAMSGRVAPDPNQTGGLLNWAKSQAGSSRAIMPTIPGLTVPPAVQQILRQIAPLSTKANELAGTVKGGQAINPSTGQFAPGGTMSGVQANAQQPTSGATGQASPAWVSQIVQQAVQAALGGGGSGDIGAVGASSGTSGPSGPGPAEPGPSEGGSIGGQTTSEGTGGGSMSSGGGFGGSTGSPEGSLGGPY